MITSFKNLMIQTVNAGVSILPHNLLRQLSKQKLILPFYHTVSDEDCPHIKNLYAVKGTKNFIDDLDFLLKHYRAIDYHEFQEIVVGKKQIKHPCFLLSFDDGLKEFHDVIAPILLRKGIPAICFLNSGFIDNKDLFFRYKASLLIDKIEGNSKLRQSASILFDNEGDINQNILSIRYHDKQILDEIADLIEYNFEDYLSNQRPYLTTQQIQSLIDKGFTFGAHSVDHPEYQYLPLDEQIRQTKESMQFIQDKFSLDYRIFSFPFTDYKVFKKFFDKVQQDKIVDHTFACAGQKKDSILNNFQRIPFEVANYSAETILNNELLYYILKTPLGKNMIKRT